MTHSIFFELKELKLEIFYSVKEFFCYSNEFFKLAKINFLIDDTFIFFELNELKKGEN